MFILDTALTWMIYFGGVALLFLTAELGYHFGRWLRSRNPEEGKNRVTGSLVGGLIGLMAFFLALTIGTVVGQHSARKAMVVTEANAIGTAFLRAGFLEEPDRTTTRDLLEEYVEVRLAAADEPEMLESSITRSEEIQNQLWSIVEENVWQGHESVTMALFVESINEVIDVHTERITSAQRRLPMRYRILLVTAAILSFFLTGYSSSADEKPARISILLYAIGFMSIFLIVIDLDRPQEGFITVSQQAMSDLLNQMAQFGS